MDGIEAYTKPPRFLPRVVKVLVGPEHYDLGHRRHRHRHHHRRHHLFSRIGHFSFPPRPTKPHVAGEKPGRQKPRNTSKLIHSEKFVKQAVRLLLTMRKRLKSSGVKQGGGTHLKANNTMKEGARISSAGYSISMLPKIRSVVQRDGDVTGRARAAFARARQIVDKTHIPPQEPKPPTAQGAQNNTNITKDTKLSSAVTVLADAVQKASEAHTVNGTGASNKTKTPSVPGLAARRLNGTDQKTLLHVLEDIKQNLTQKQDGRFVGRVIAHLRSLSDSISRSTGAAKDVLAEKLKGMDNPLTNATTYSKSDNLKEVPKESRNKTGGLQQDTGTLETFVQHENGGSIQHAKVLNGSSVAVVERKNSSITTGSDHIDNNKVNDNSSSSSSSSSNKNNSNNDNNNSSNNNNNNNTNNNDNNNSKIGTSSDRSMAFNHSAALIQAQVSTVRGSAAGGQNSSRGSNTTVDRLSKAPTGVSQSVALNQSGPATRSKGNVETGEAKYLLSPGQGNHTAGVKMSKQKLASRKAFGLAMKLVKAALAREELRKAEQELYGKMKEMMNKTVPTAAAMSPAQAEQGGNQDSNAVNPASNGGPATSSGKNKKQDAESQAKYNEAAHLEERIAAQQDKMYDDLVNRILDNDDRGDDDGGDGDGTVRELAGGPRDDYGDFKDSDEEMDQRMYGSRAGDSSRYTLRNVVLKPNASSPRRKGLTAGNSTKGKKNEIPKKRDSPHQTVGPSADTKRPAFNEAKPRTADSKTLMHAGGKQKKEKRTNTRPAEGRKVTTATGIQDQMPKKQS